MPASGRTLGPYHLEDSLGGTRSVFRARHLESGDIVCVKLLPEHLRLDAISRGRRKRDLLATRHVRHPGVGRPLDFVDADGRLFLVMEYVDGAPLSMSLFGETALSVSRAIRVVRGACEAVAAAHASHATHGCIEPDKVLVGEDGLVHVVGFGFRDEDALKNPGGDVPADVDLCTAPERWSGAFETTDADVWALGALLYRCLTGAYPVTALTRVELSRKVQTTEIPPPALDLDVVKAAIDAVALRALSRDPALRYPDAAVFARALVEVESMLKADEPDATTGAPAPPPIEERALIGLPPVTEGPFSAPLPDPYASGLPTASEEGPPVGGDAFSSSEDVPVPPPEEDLDVDVDVDVDAQPSSTSEELPPLAPYDAGLLSHTPPPLSRPHDDAIDRAVADAIGDDDIVMDDLPMDDQVAAAEPPPMPVRETPPAMAPVALVEAPPAPSAPRRDTPKGRGRLLAVAAVAAAAVAAVLVVDPLGLRAGALEGAPVGERAAVAAQAASAVPSTVPSDEPPSVPDTGPTAEAPVVAEVLPDAGAAAPLDAGADDDTAEVDDAATKLATADNGDDQPAVDAEDGSADPPAEDDTEPKVAAASASGSPEEAYEAAEQALEEVISSRKLLWKDDRGLDKLRLKSRRQAKLKRYDRALKSAGEALAAAKAVEIDDKLVKRKLLRYVKRRKELGTDDVVKRAQSIEYRARKHLKDGEHEEANQLLNAGLRLMYKQGDDDG